MRFLGIVALVFLNFDMMLETHMKLCVTESHFLEKELHQKIGQMTKNKSKIVFFEFIEKLRY